MRWHKPTERCVRIKLRTKASKAVRREKGMVSIDKESQGLRLFCNADSPYSHNSFRASGHILSIRSFMNYKPNVDRFSINEFSWISTMMQTSNEPAPKPTPINFKQTPSPSICGAVEMVGKTVKCVDWGDSPEKSKELHNSEMMVIYFDDGSSLEICTGSNAWNLVGKTIKPKDLNVDLNLIWRNLKTLKE